MKRCAWCLGPLLNGSATCSDACARGMERLMPTPGTAPDTPGIRAAPLPRVTRKRTAAEKAAWGAKMRNRGQQELARARPGM